MSSLSRATVFRVSDLKKHENADMLMVGQYDGCPFIVNMNDTHEGDLRIFVPFDMICPSETWVGEFVRGKRVRPVRLRGVFSMAVCLPLPEGCEASEGEDVTERLGFTKWEPPETGDTSDGIITDGRCGYTETAPRGLHVPHYDLESLRKYHGEFHDGEAVVITEKIEGENIAIVYWEDQFYVRSRNRWISDGDNKWWNAFRRYDWSFLRNRPGLVAFGEKYGNVNNFRYDCADGEQKIKIFDLYDSSRMMFLPWMDFICNIIYGLAPVLYEGPWLGLDQHKHLAEGQSSFGSNIREGIVVKSRDGRYNARGERLIYKYPGEDYLILKGKRGG